MRRNTIHLRSLACVGSLLALLLSVAGCGHPAGTPCQTVGSGFTASHDCRHRCLSRWQVTCPDGERVTPNTCSGSFGCTPGSCPDGQVCYHDDDPFDDRSFCVMSTTCGELDDDALEAWERERVAAQERVRVERAEKEERRARWRAENPDALATMPGAAPAAPPAPAAPRGDSLEAKPDAPPAASMPGPESPQPGTSPPSPQISRVDDLPPPLPCDSTAERLALRIPVPDGEAPFDDSVFVEIEAGQDWSWELPYGWQLALLAQDHGWSLRLFDRVRGEGRVDLSSVTPPHHGPANSRDIEGWHFRNAANTGPNSGDVNAPQRLRLFEFSPALIGTGGYRPSANPHEPRLGAEAGSPGRGWLRLLDYRLADLEAGRRARMASMKFQACLTLPHPSPHQIEEWEQRLEEQQRALDSRDPSYREEEREMLGACGLDASSYELQSRITPRRLDLDIDGDEVADSVYQVRRRSDDAPMLALCRAGTWLALIGPGQATAQDEDFAMLVHALEAWRVVAPDHGSFGYVEEAPWPEPTGDVLVLERIEKGMGIVYWQDGSIHTRSLYRFVEP